MPSADWDSIGNSYTLVLRPEGAAPVFKHVAETVGDPDLCEICTITATWYRAGAERRGAWLVRPTSCVGRVERGPG